MKRLIVALALIWTAHSIAFANEAAAGKRLALLIGNQKYTEAVGPLTNPHNDIVLVGAALGEVGFKVHSVKDASRLNVLSAVRNFGKKLRAAGPNAVGFFYYSGHGAAETEIGPNYLIPTNVQDTEDSAIWDESVPLRKIITLLKQSAPQAAHFIVFDACRNELKTRHKSVSKGFVAEHQEAGVYIAFATAQNQKASDLGDASGPYAKALATELVKPGRDHLHVFHSIRKIVHAETGQMPWVRDGLVSEIYFASRKSVNEKTQLHERKVNDGSNFQEINRAAQTWTAIQNTSSMAVLEAFIKKFHATLFVDFAKARLEELKTKQLALQSERVRPTRETQLAAAPPSHSAEIVRKGKAAENIHLSRPHSARERCVGRLISGNHYTYCVSSTLPTGDVNKWNYGPEGLIDGSDRTAWVEGRTAKGDYGVGEWIVVDLGGRKEVKGISIKNGYSKSERIYRVNGRVRKAELIFSSGQRKRIFLEDNRELQNKFFDPPIEAQWVQFRILSAKRGEKYSDTAVNEFRVITSGG